VALTRQSCGKVALLLNLASLCHPSRTALWRQPPPARLYAIDDIVCWPEHRYGPAPDAFTIHRYVWAVWTPDHGDTTTFSWLSTQKFH
jgi:hypothetical protein